MTTTTHPALTAAENLNHRRDVCRRWCEQAGGLAPGAWTYWSEQEDGARASQEWDNVCRHLPVELLHPVSEPHYLVFAHEGRGWTLRSVHVKKAGALRVEAESPNGQRFLESVVLAWDAPRGEYVVLTGSEKH